MDQKQNYREKYEKGKLHTRYLFIIAGILAVIGVSIALGGNSEALGQISMASTVSSIILSSIAIFMSISGENKLNYTHDKLVETSERMSGITDNIEQANSLLKDTINQTTKIDDICDRLERIGQSVDKVEQAMLKRTFQDSESSTVNISNDILWQIYNKMIGKQDDIVEKIIVETIEYAVVCRSENAMLTVDNLEKYLNSVSGADTFATGFAAGTLHAFVAMGILKENNIKFFKEKIALSDAKWNEIKMFL